MEFKVLWYDRSTPALQEVLRALAVRDGGSWMFRNVGKLLPVYKAFFTFHKTSNSLSKYSHVLKQHVVNRRGSNSVTVKSSLARH
jgi:hypothetical protein